LIASIVCKGRHRVQMASLGCEVEREIPAFEEVPHNVVTADIGYIDLHPIADIDNIRRIATIFGDHAVDYKDSCAQPEEAACPTRNR
jgi:hypothetical protein